jgi:hypothetical protein
LTAPRAGGTMLPVGLLSNVQFNSSSPSSWAHHTAGRSAAVWIALTALSLCGVGLVLLCTATYGAGISPDSASYMSASRSLLAGKGYLCPEGWVYTQWAPLFPTLLAGFGLFGIEPAVASRFLNAVVFGLIIFVSGRLFLRSTTMREFALLGTLSLLVSAPLLGVSVMVWSEPVFILLALLFLLCLPRFLRTGGSPGRLILVSILAALACLQRYAGVSLILTGALLILTSLSGASIRRRLKYLAGFGILSSAPLAAWLYRNHLTGRTTGGQSLNWAAVKEMGQTCRRGGEIVAAWLFDPSWPASNSLIGLGVILALIVVLTHLARRRLNDSDTDRALQIRCAAVFGPVYFGFLAFCASGLYWMPEQRTLSPIYVVLMLCVVAGIENACRLLGKVLRCMPIVESVCVALCVAWLLGRQPIMRRQVAGCIQVGTSPYCSAVWQESPLILWLRDHPLSGGVFSNAPDAVYILTGIGAETTPPCSWDIARFARRLASAEASYVVWFYRKNHESFWDLPELLSRYEMEEMVDLPDGRIYRAHGVVRPEPWLQAVHCFLSPHTNRHFYTIDKQESDKLRRDPTGTWVYEGASFYAYPGSQTGLCPVYRLKSDNPKDYFYTISEAEKDRRLRDEPDAWKEDGVAFYAYPEKSAEDLSPVYRLRSADLPYYFYTTSENAKAKLLSRTSRGWTDDGIAWYAYKP